jgi:hypothetical protein
MGWHIKLGCSEYPTTAADILLRAGKGENLLVVRVDPAEVRQGEARAVVGRNDQARADENLGRRPIGQNVSSCGDRLFGGV